MPVVLVTGGTRGIGLGIAQAFEAAGYTVATCARRAVEGHPYDFHAADVRDPEQVAAVVDAVVAAHGRLDVLVNNAGGGPPAMAATASPRFHDKIIALNLTAPLHFAQRANAVMQAQDGGGVIVNIASVAGHKPSPQVAAYAAAKAGLINLTKTLAVEWAPAVRVVCVTPGLIWTEQAADFYADGADAIAATVPAGRFGTPDDIGAACVFVASPAASYISGSELVVDGGGELPAWLRAKESS